ncbi:hypothetical protein EBT31_10585 [bacterium]|jgi:hypothetical protein|nr:hypothetical protein [bacterium]
MDIRVARLNEIATPSYVVGFSVTHTKSGQSVYLDAFVPKEEATSKLTEEQIAQKAWVEIKDRADAFLKECDRASDSIVGKQFIPPS